MEFSPIALGRTLRVAHSDSFTFTEVQHEPGAFLATHAHENRAVSLVVRGMRTYRFGGQAFDCRAGSVVFIPAGAAHSSLFATEEGRGVMLELRPGVDVPRQLFEHPRSARDAQSVQRWETVRREIWFPDEMSPLALESLGLELLVREARAGSDGHRAPRWLERVRESLNDLFRTPPTLAVLAETAGVERSRLTREFRRHFHTSVAEYVRGIRARYAWDLVACTEMPLCEVAARCGFADQSHLTRTFRKMYRITPGRLRLERAGHSIDAPAVQYRSARER